MAEVGVHRLAPGHHQHQRAEDQQRLVEPSLAEERQAEPWIERPQDLRLADDLRQAEDGDDDEPDDEDRPEDDSDARGALELDGEQPRQQRDRDRYDVGGEGGRGDVEPLDRRQHADRRRDHAVAEQQAGPQHQPPQQHQRAALLVLERVKEAVEREDAAFALVLRADDQQRVLDGDNQRDRPDRQRDRAEHGARRRRDLGGNGEDLVDGVERRGADVAIDDAERPDRQSGEPAARPMCGALFAARRRARGGGVAGRGLNLGHCIALPAGVGLPPLRAIRCARLISRRRPKPFPADAPGCSGALDLHRPPALTRR